MRLFRSVLLLSAIAPAAVWSAGLQSSSGSADTLKVVIVGSGGGPAVNLRRYGPSIVVEAAGERLLFDCGRGAMMRLTQLGIPLEGITRLFLTHLHSDHVLDLPDLLLTGWTAGRTTPLEVWGPRGTAGMMDHLLDAFAFDIRVRRDIDEGYSAEGITVRSHEIDAGTVFERGGLKVTAFVVDHGPVKPAFGYRIDYTRRSVALSGDTAYSENLIRAARDVDVLIHEAMDPAEFRARQTNLTAEQVERVIAHHTTPEQAAQVFTRVAPRLAVYAHAPTSPGVMARTRALYGGRLEAGEDMMSIDIGEAIEVRRFAR